MSAEAIVEEAGLVLVGRSSGSPCDGHALSGAVYAASALTGGRAPAR